MGGEHTAWHGDQEPEYDDDTGSWRIPDKTRTPGYRGYHRRTSHRRPSRVRGFLYELAWRLGHEPEDH